MTTAGIYGYHPKVEHATTIFPQMTSGGFQTPFFFGGSQVPLELHHMTGSGFRTKYKYARDMQEVLGTQGRGIHTTIEKNNKIMLPKKMFHK